MPLKSIAKDTKYVILLFHKIKALVQLCKLEISYMQ